MLVIISDLHLGDGTTAASIPASAFKTFSKRLQETANYASFDENGKFRPIEELDVVMLGDIIDPLHSTLWLDTMPGDEGYVRPWSDWRDPKFASKLSEVTDAILSENAESLQILRECAAGEQVYLSPSPKSSELIPVKVRFHYAVGNHDWYYRLPGEGFGKIRQTLIDALGLSNTRDPFPHELDEKPALRELLSRYKVFGRHGDRFDRFNFDPEKGRNHATLGDAFTMDVCNRFPVEVNRTFGEALPAGVVDGLRRITNIRPTLAVPVWIRDQIRVHAVAPAIENEIKEIWDRLAEEFLQLDFVREADKAFQFDLVDAMQLVVRLSGRVSYATINDVMMFIHKRMWHSESSFSRHALNEPAYKDKSARFIVYGHTHHHEMVPLNLGSGSSYDESQIYFNSGTWHSYFDLAIEDPDEQKFIPYETLTYLTFYLDEEHGRRNFESWTGAFA